MSRFDRQFRRHELAPGLAGYSGGTPDPVEIEALVRSNARRAGCTCDVAVDVPDNYGERGQVAEIKVYHDDDCPLPVMTFTTPPVGLRRQGRRPGRHWRRGMGRATRRPQDGDLR